MQQIDRLLNRFTTYRVVLYGLILFLVVAFIFGLTGTISVQPGGLALSVAILLIVAGLSSKALSEVFRIPTNLESWIITALILACILPPVNTLAKGLEVALAAVIAMASKYILSYRKGNIFNPAAIAAFILSVTGILPAIWWIGSPALAPFTALVGFLVLRRLRRFSLFFSFALSSLLIMLLIGSVFHGQAPFYVLKDAVLSWPLLFLGTIMLTEPTTLPSFRYYQILYGALVGVIFASQLKFGFVSATPEAALIVGNIFTLFVTPSFSAKIKLKKITQLSADIFDLEFNMPSQLRKKYLPGQYLEWTLPHSHVDQRGNRRTFSIASAPTEQELHIGIRRYELSSSYKKALLNLKPGQSMRVAHLSGDFVLQHNPKQPLVFIAGGIGITPFRSMIKYLGDTGQARDINLFYVANKKDDFVYTDVLDKAKAVGIETDYVISKVSTEKLKASIKPGRDQLFYVSGSSAMVQHYVSLLKSLGIGNLQIRTDYFSGY